ncbi:hypothetical protein [Puniceibacterium confluentis]|uniref:hypothetical protein n=1 Tax=Puniceibacterium confluentis TaxID=1958944 RepID=UPI001FE90F6D|nr:hypothetical protein [Puniceibacterium confluentis]
MISQEFPNLGWQFLSGDVAPTRVQVFGERSSGTNFVKRLIGRNTGLVPIEDLGWKHGFPQMTAIPQDVLVVTVVRDARDWTLSMFAKPWHATPEMQRMEFSAFIRTGWATIADRPRYFPQSAAHGSIGQPLQFDRHPITGAVFDNLFALRRAKLHGHLSLLSRTRPAALVRLEAAQADPQGFLSALCGALGLPPAETYRPVVKRLGAKFRPSVDRRPTVPARLSVADLAFLRTETDVRQEAQLGYVY